MANIIASGSWWRLENDGTLYVYCVGDMPDYGSAGNLSPWYYNWNQIQKIVLQSGVTRIGNYAFTSCLATSATIPSSVISIGEGAFEHCHELTSVTIPNSVTSIEMAAFFGTSLTDVVIPGSVTSIGSGAFSYCESLTSVTVPDPDSANYWWSDVFDHIAPLTSLTISDGVTSISDAAFSGIAFADNGTVTIPNGVTSIGDWAFESSGLTSITIPDSVISIGEGAFSECTSLVNATIPNSVTSIGSYAFYRTSLINVVIPGSVTSIGSGAFSYCESLTSVTVPDSGSANYWWSDVFDHIAPLTSLTIPDGVTSIGDNSFHVIDFADNGTVTIPNSVTSIGDSVFSVCGGLTNITIPDGVTSIGASAFSECYDLTTVTIPNSVASIGDWAFNTCDNLTDVYYGGTESEWNAVALGEYNGLEYATIHYTETPTPVPEPVALESIAVTTPPTKTTYAEGEAFDPSGMIVTASYSDASTAAVTGYIVSPSGSLATSDSAVTVRYMEDGVPATATVEITVTMKPFSTSWPRSAREVMREIAYRIGAPLDPRTVLGADEIEDTALKMSMREVAGYIAAMNGGNWTITDDGYLYLVPLGMAAQVLGDENGVPILFGEALLLV